MPKQPAFPGFRNAMKKKQPLWAVMHQCVTHNHHYPTQKQFADAILRFFQETLPNEWETFRNQVSDNFRVVTHEKFRVLG